MIRRTLPLLLALACALALASCNHSAKPVAHPTRSGPSAGSASGPSAPATVSAADRKAEEQAVTLWVDTLNAASTSGKTGALRKLSAKACTVCTDFAHHLDTIYAAGGHVETTGWTLKSMIPVVGQALPTIRVVATVEPQKVYNSKHAKVKKYPGGEQDFQFVLVRKHGHLLVHHIDVGPS